MPTHRNGLRKALRLNPRYLGASEWLGELHYRAAG
jgi:hypothetical protein